MIEMDKIKIGDKVQIIGNTKIYHNLAVPSIAEIIDVDSNSVKVFGYGDDGKTDVQWVSFVDIKPIRKAVVL